MNARSKKTTIRPKTWVVVMNDAEVHAGTDSIVIHNRADKVIFANTNPNCVAVITWTPGENNRSGCPFEVNKRWASAQRVEHGRPLTMCIASKRVAPDGRYYYKVSNEGQAYAAGRGVGDGTGGGEIIIQP
jgi:hypothetical protein